MKQVRWERMFPDQLEDAFRQCPVVYFPYGLCEPHGPHNALGLDALKAHGICCRTAQEHGGIVAPPDYWHIHEVGHYANWAHKNVGNVPRTWMTSMPPWQHFKNVCYHIRTADVMGFEAAIFLTGHYGLNWKDLRTLIDLVQPHVGTRLYGLPDFEANNRGFTNEDGAYGGDHAGRIETSLLWALEPDCVDASRLPESCDSPGAPHFAMGRTAFESDRRVGERMVADEVRFLGQKAQQLRQDYAAAKPQHTLLTFGDVEALWSNVIVPELPAFHTMQQRHELDPSDLPADSIWGKNQAINWHGH